MRNFLVVSKYVKNNFKKNEKLTNLMSLKKYNISYNDVVVTTFEKECLIFNGKLYNASEIAFECNSSTINIAELIRIYLSKNGINAINNLNGAFSIVYVKDDILYLFTDQVGIKPVYYSLIDGDIISSSNIKLLLDYFGKTVVDKEGICELLGIGPSRSLGKTIYKNISVVKPGSYIKYDGKVCKEIEYYKLMPKKLSQSFEETKIKFRKMFEESCFNQMNKFSIGSLLSGGLDSTIVTYEALKHCDNLNTYSIDYEDNNKDYKSNSFETSNDQDYLKYVLEKYQVNNSNYVISNEKLLKYLEEVIDYRDGPGMTTIDASLYYLFKKISKNNKVIVGGECADEILGGYPWFNSYNEFDVFPWMKDIELKDKIINKDLNISLVNYVKNEFNQAKSNVLLLEEDDGNNLKRVIYYLNVKYFMLGLIRRANDLSDAVGVDLRIPFADKDLIQYLYNVDYSYKYNGCEKYLLREAYKKDIPYEIYTRKKSPYPKSQSKVLSKLILNKYKEAINDKTSILHKLIDIIEVNKIIEANEDILWYGQLMRKTELLAYLYQIHLWAKKYNVILEI